MPQGPPWFSAPPPAPPVDLPNPEAEMTLGEQFRVDPFGASISTLRGLIPFLGQDNQASRFGEVLGAAAPLVGPLRRLLPASRVRGLLPPGPAIPPEPGSLPVPPGRVRGYHYTEALDQVRQHGLDVSHARGSTYGEPNAIWFSTEKPKDFKHYVEVHLDPDEMAIGNPTHPWMTPEQRLHTVEEFNQGGHDFTVHPTQIPPERFATHYEPWHQRYRAVENDRSLLDEVLRGQHDHLLDDPEYGRAIRAIKARYGPPVGAPPPPPPR